MSESKVTAALGAEDRRARVFARARAFATDSLLVAYALWCASFLQGHAAGEFGRQGWLESAGGFVGRRPWLLLAAPFAAALWQAMGTSLGQRVNRVRVLDAAGEAASPTARAWQGLFAGLQAAVILFPAVLGVLAARAGGSAGFHFFLSSLLALAFLAIGLVDGHARGLPERLAGTRTGLAPQRETVIRRPWWRRANPWIVILLLVLTFAVALALTGFDPLDLLRNAHRTADLWADLASPDWSIVARVVEKMVETVFLALLASALALPFAFVLSFLGARNLMTASTAGRVIYVATRVFMNVTRSIEPILWAIIFGLWVGVGPAAGMLALFVHSVAALGKLYSEAIESIDPGPVEAISATGANRLQVLRYGVVPQVVPPFLSFTVYRWDINVRMATILGFVGGGGIGELIVPYIQLSAWSKVGLVAIFITIVVWAMDWASSKARERLT